MNLESLLTQHCAKVKTVGRDKFTVTCPAHDDNAASCSVRLEGSKVLVNCFAGCDPADIVKALGYDSFSDLEASLGLKDAGFFEERPEDGIFRTYFGGKPLVSIHPYVTENGTPVVTVARYGTVNKQFAQYVPDPLNHGKMVPGKGDSIPSRRPLYRLQEVAKAKGWIFVVEGEKAADALASYGVVATTSLGGATAPGRTSWNHLAGKNVCVWPDNDEPGMKYAEEVKRLLRELPVVPAKLVTVDVAKMNVAPKEDAYDWLKATKLERTEESRKIIESIPVSCVLELNTIVEPIRIDLACDEFMSLPTPEYDPLVPGLLNRGESMMIFGKPGCGKTWITLGLGLAISSGRNYLGWGTRKSKVLYIDGEMPIAKMQKRISIMSKIIGCDPVEVSSNFHIISRNHMHSGGLGEFPSLSTRKGKDLVEARAEGVEVVIFDNISCLWSASDNDEEDQILTNQWFVKMRSEGKTLIVVHHPNKVGESQRGNSKRADPMDLIWKLRPPDSTSYIDNITRAELFFEKARDLEPMQMIPLLVTIDTHRYVMEAQPIL